MIAADRSRSSPPPAPSEVIRIAARAFEPDRYLSALLAARPARDDLLALAAYAGEIARIPAMVQEPVMGQIRLQWWRDGIALEGSASTGSPIADAMRRAVRRRGLPAASVLAPIDAQEVLLGDAPFTTLEALEQHLAVSQGALFSLAAGICDARTAIAADTISDAAVSYGLARLLAELPAVLAQGRLPLPADLLERHGASTATIRSGNEDTATRTALAELAGRARARLAAVRRGLAGTPGPARAAFLPLAMVEPYLRGWERPGRDLLREPVEPLPLTRVWRLWRAYMTGAV